MINLKSFQRTQELATPDLLPYACMVAPGVILNKDGSYMASWFYTGKDDASMTAHDRNVTNERINAALKRLGSGWCMHFNAIRTRSDIYPDAETSFFPDAVSSMIDRERREFFEAAGNSFETVTTLTLTYTPDPVSQKKLEALFFETEGETRKNRQLAGDKTLVDFQRAIQEFEENLGVALDLRRMTEREGEIGGVAVTYDDQLSLLDFQFHHEGFRPVLVPQCGMFLDSIIGKFQFVTGVVPKIGGKFIKAITIDGLPAATSAGFLNPLSELGVEFRWCTRYIPMDAYHAVGEIRKYSRKWAQKVKGFIASLTGKPNAKINHAAAMMTADAQMAESDSSGTEVTFGYYTGTIILLHEDAEFLETASRAMRKALLRLGFSSTRIEDINAVESWLGTMCGNSFANIRRPLLHSLNLSDLLPTSSVYAGQRFNPCDFYPENSPPLAMTKTDGSTPFRLNLHVSDLAHTLIFGPTGSGKSTLLAFLAAQMLRYPRVSIFAFDKGMSMYGINQAVGGNHYNIGGETVEGNPTLAFAPLSRIESEADFQWACEWVETLVRMQMNGKVSVEKKMAIRQGMISHREASHSVRLSDFVTQVQDQEVKDALSFYTALDIYDAEGDALRDGNFECFEIEELMHFKPEINLPIMLYLFRCIEKKLTGQPAFIIIDEAWMVLGHEVFRDKLREWLKVLRKANCGVVLATQSITDAANSGILDVLSESCPTKIYLPNDRATHEESGQHYKRLGLNTAQRTIIADALPKREYFVTSPKGDRLVDLALGPVALAFCAKSSKDDLRAMKEFQSVHGQDWPVAWIAKTME